MSVHPEDAMSYADQLHRDCVAIAAQLSRIADALAKLVGDKGIVHTRDADRV